MPNGSKRVIDLIENEVKNGNISEETINKAVSRILKLKKERLNKRLSNDKYGLKENKKFICDNFNDYCSYNK